MEPEFSRPFVQVDVVEAGKKARSGRICCEIDRHIESSTEDLAAYCLAQWQPVVYDALLMAAAVEFCDRVKGRPTLGWSRDIELRLPVHHPERWTNSTVRKSLHDALNFLTGDRWEITFSNRVHPVEQPRQSTFQFPDGSLAIIPFSDGLDSLAVAGLMRKELGDRLIRVRLGSKIADHRSRAKHDKSERRPFTSVPYLVKRREYRFRESSSRSRGFKFAVMSGLAAYLSGATRIIVPESGQGALGPSLIPVGHAYEDYRNHPLFARRMEKFFKALLNHTVKFEFPRLWSTKGQTLKAFVNQDDTEAHWQSTRSCWQDSRQVSVDRKKRQCGVCTTCMLRRLSVHAAGLSEPQSMYVWENLRSETFELGAAPNFLKITSSMREYAIAGTLHLDHLAAYQNAPAGRHSLRLHVAQLSEAEGLPEVEVEKKLRGLLSQHENEWKDFMRALGPTSFVADWALHRQ